MRIFLTGVSCVGKTTIGEKMGKLLGIRFYDIDSRPSEKKLTPKEKKLYLREIKKEITYFHTSYQRANLHVDISGLNADKAARKVKETIEQLDG